MAVVSLGLPGLHHDVTAARRGPRCDLGSRHPFPGLRGKGRALAVLGGRLNVNISQQSEFRFRNG